MQGPCRCTRTCKVHVPLLFKLSLTSHIFPLLFTFPRSFRNFPILFTTFAYFSKLSTAFHNFPYFSQISAIFAVYMCTLHVHVYMESVQMGQKITQKRTLSTALKVRRIKSQARSARTAAGLSEQTWRDTRYHVSTWQAAADNALTTIHERYWANIVSGWFFNHCQQKRTPL